MAALPSASHRSNRWRTPHSRKDRSVAKRGTLASRCFADTSSTQFPLSSAQSSWSSQITWKVSLSVKRPASSKCWRYAARTSVVAIMACHSYRSAVCAPASSGTGTSVSAYIAEVPVSLADWITDAHYPVSTQARRLQRCRPMPRASTAQAAGIGFSAEASGCRGCPRRAVSSGDRRAGSAVRNWLCGSSTNSVQCRLPSRSLSLCWKSVTYVINCSSRTSKQTAVDCGRP